ncbi:hypothetical protein OPIT5_00635 [Opitutaceae bacterium TAV5]|nr:hypothetical protein OPIT5_00635 [Opitutaceae bacterium TAV5]
MLPAVNQDQRPETSGFSHPARKGRKDLLMVNFAFFAIFV